MVGDDQEGGEACAEIQLPGCKADLLAGYAAVFGRKGKAGLTCLAGGGDCAVWGNAGYGLVVGAPHHLLLAYKGEALAVQLIVGGDFWAVLHIDGLGLVLVLVGLVLGVQH